MTVRRLPVHAVVEQLEQTLAAGNAILYAPPGAGKTTVVPLALRNALWLNGGKIIMLEPRRLAARAAARRLASSLGEKPGQTVGYRMRMDSKVGRTSRIVVVTEGVLTRMIQADPALQEVGLLIFDEFHERSLHADLGLALSLESQSALRPDLRILIMSATLQAAPLARMLGNAAVVECHGRAFPVTTYYRPPAKELPVASAAAAAVRTALDETQGDILVFLPGGHAIRAAAAQIQRFAGAGRLLVAPLYGDLPDDAQEVAIAPAPAGRRKVVLATNIAESSLTIDGVCCVIDSGLHNSPVFDAASGMSRLATQQVSRASADQRRGRAGRTAPGTCIRLWSRDAHQRLMPFAQAEIQQADLTPLALELALWGVRDPGSLSWLDAPPAAAWSRATELLHQLGAIDTEGRITPHGTVMASLGAHPRLAHMLVIARSLEAAGTAADIAAVLGERDFLQFEAGVAGADLDYRLTALRDANAIPAGASIRRGAFKRVKAVAGRWKKLLNVRESSGITPPVSAGLLVAIAFPDRIAMQRAGRRHCYRLSAGRGACVKRGDPLASHQWLAVAAADAGISDGQIYLAAALAKEEVLEHFADRLSRQTQVHWDEATKSVIAAEVTQLGALTVAERTLRSPPPEKVAQALLEGIRRAGIDALPWSGRARSMRERVNWLSQLQPPAGGLEWPAMNDAQLLQSLEHWLAPWLEGMSRLAHLKKLNLTAAMGALLQAPHHAALDRLAPTSLTVPSGSSIALDYAVNPAEGQTPVLRVRLQEMFGLKQTPRIAGETVPITVHLLSPAGRPVQITRDLGNFWRATYAEVRRDLKGRYPKHYWPDDPLTAVATRRVRPRN